MKRIFWILILFTSLPVFAQQNFASISFGASIPLADYAATGDLATSGYASTGGAIKFDVGYYPGSYFGIGGSFSFGSNYAIRDSLLKDMLIYIEENASSIIDIPDYAEILYGSGFWNYINIFLGPQFSIRVTQKFYFDFRALAGLSIVRPPDQELGITYNETEIFSQVDNNKASFGLTAGTGIRYDLNSNIALKLGVDYYQARAKFEYAWDLFKDVAQDIPPIESNFLVQTLELSVGLAYYF